MRPIWNIRVDIRHIGSGQQLIVHGISLKVHKSAMEAGSAGAVRFI